MQQPAYVVAIKGKLRVIAYAVCRDGEELQRFRCGRNWRLVLFLAITGCATISTAGSSRGDSRGLAVR